MIKIGNKKKTCETTRTFHSMVGNTTGTNNIDTLVDILQKTSLPKKEKMKRIYEDDDFIIDLINNDEPILE